MNDNKTYIGDLYVDLNLGLTTHPLTGDLVDVKGENAVKRSVKHIVLQDAYDIPFEPDYTTGISSMLFDNPTPMLISTVRDRVDWLVSKLEPRVKITDIDVDFDGTLLDITIHFTITSFADLESSVNVTIQRER